MLHVTGFKLHDSRPGFTILESLTVIAILLIVAVVGFISLKYSKSRTALEEGRAVMTEALEDARSKAATGVSTTDHGVHIQPDRFFIFEGHSYPATTSTERLLPFGVTTNQASTTIIFKRLTALPSATATVVLTNSAGATTSVEITESGAIIGKP